MVFQPWNTLSEGRPVGSRNRRSFELEERLRNRGDTDPADFLSSLITNQNESTELRAAASNYLLPYLYSKRGAMPPPRYVELEINVTEFTHVSQAEAALAKIAIDVANGRVYIQSAQEVSALIKDWINIQYSKEEIQFKINPPETRDTTITVVGGLPALPGTQIEMPQLNGHVADARVLAAPTDIVPSTNQAQTDTPTEFSPGELKAQGPHPLQEHHFKDPGQNSGNGQGPETKDGDTAC
jgi:hypothetical protein